LGSKKVGASSDFWENCMILFRIGLLYKVKNHCMCNSVYFKVLTVEFLKWTSPAPIIGTVFGIYQSYYQGETF
jgi:hypothetical protein